MLDTATVAPTDKRVIVHLTYDPRVNLALQQNAVPVVREFRLENPGQDPLEDLVLAVWAEPNLCQRWERRLTRLEPGATWDVGIPDLPFPPDRLANLTEREAGQLHLEVTRQGEQLLAQTHPLELLAYNEWSGTMSLPEALAAFVLPNHPAIENLLRQARKHLERWTGNPAFDGYQSRDPNRARMQAAAIFTAIADLDITYVGTPASFERTGQKVRTPDQLVESRMGNCLDLTVFMAAAVEQAGLNPLLVLVEGHAFPGLWLAERCLPQPEGDDALALRKRAEVGEMAFFDSSAAATRPRIPFEQAEQIARKELDETGKFLYAVDVKASRNQRIRPLPIRLKAGGGYTVLEPEPAIQAAAPAAPAALRSTLPQDSTAKVRELPDRRLDRWKSKLLDLSLRNRLLNYRPGSKCVPLVCPDIATMEDGLAAETAFQILPRPDRRGDGRNLALHEQQTGEDLERQFLLKEMQAGRLHADLAPADLSKRLVTLFREARANLEETGASTLYLALGFLEWYETPSSPTARRAPILLLPLEILRGAVTEPYRIRLADDEARLNATILEKLRRDFNIQITTLDELPQDASGLDIPLIFDTFRRAVLNLPRWQVVEEAHIGHFSFTKFLMWLDLAARKDQLLESPVVRHLAESGATPLPPVDFMSPQQVDERPPSEVFCPLDADSSQLSAVFAAEKGNSFVLQGPPGTGKSQTITNMIAHSLAHGRTVLFVSEKRAALEVVHRRLEAIGLAPFCLELHSNKTNKTDVMRQLQEALDFTGTAAPKDWELKSRQLQELRRELNRYVTAVHQERPLGRSVFEVTAELIRLRDLPQLPWQGQDAAVVSREAMESLRAAVDRLASTAQLVGVPHEHPWWGAGWTDWSPVGEREVVAHLALAAQAVQGLQAALDAAATVLNLPAEDWSRADVEALAGLGQDLVASPDPPLELLTRPRWKELRRQVDEMLEHARRRRETWDSVAPRYTEGLLQLPLETLHKSYQQHKDSHALVGFFKLWGPRGALKKVARGTLGPATDVARDLAAALEVAAEDRWLADAATEARSLLGSTWKAADTDPQEVNALVEWAENFRNRLVWVEERFPAQAEAVRTGLARLATEAEDRLDPARPAGQHLRALGRAMETWSERLADLKARLGIDEERAWSPGAGFLPRLGQCLATWQANLPRLRDWSAYQSANCAACAAGLRPLVAAHEQGQVCPEHLLDAFLRSFYDEWLSRTVSADELLRNFRGLEHERKVERFGELDQESLRLMQAAAVSRLAARVPDRTLGASVNGSEMHILTRELTKKRKHMPCRKLFEKLPNLLTRLKPCVLMSPLSVAQYLDPSLPPYDLIVFDEASQIPVWDAIGAIARGSQVVVVGDSKQLPPTSFFCIGDSDEDEAPDEDNIEEAESILDECEATAMPRHPLTWHYRSRHESLITFSNQHYYESRLNTFPCAEAEVAELGVHWRHVPNGWFDRGASRTNRAEAEAVVAEIVVRLKDPQRRGKSIGVVTFNQSQQNLVEDLLEQARRDDPAIEPFFGPVEEPVFVKNLENVQGDERDVILFSVAYGPDRTGKVSMNFGPLNRDGGERRLNVAITRARELLVVFSTLQADMIDLARSGAKGLAHFKRFLDFAHRGPKAILEAKAGHEAAEAESPFEEAVARELESRGLTVHRQVGCSGFRVDVAVVDPFRPGSYLLGVQCDGASYCSSPSARDRDRLRRAVLKGLGWRLHRTWSSDWWYDPAREVARIQEALRQARTEVDRRPAPAPRPAVPSGPPPEPSPIRFEAVAAAPPPAAPALPPGSSLYRRTPVDTLEGSPESFEYGVAIPNLQATIRKVLQNEAPITPTELVRRVCALWGIPRLTRRVEERIKACLAPHLGRIVGDAVWLPEQDPANWKDYRLAASGEAPRDLESIPLLELANAADALLQQCCGLPQGDLVRGTAQLFAVQRLGKRLRERLDQAVALLASQDRCQIEDGTVSLPR